MNNPPPKKKKRKKLQIQWINLLWDFQYVGPHLAICGITGKITCKILHSYWSQILTGRQQIQNHRHMQILTNLQAGICWVFSSELGDSLNSVPKLGSSTLVLCFMWKYGQTWRGFLVPIEMPWSLSASAVCGSEPQVGQHGSVAKGDLRLEAI